MANVGSLKNLADKIAAVRQRWGAGPWSAEPDRVEWTTEAGHPALVVRTIMGHLCGYVAVEKGHPLYGKGSSDSECDNIPCHGGVTYGNKCAGAICHVPEAGKPDDVWWLGFDCAHCDDLSPAANGPQTSFASARSRYGTYRTVEYVKRECEAMADYLASVT